MKKRVLKVATVGFLTMAVLITVPKTMCGTINISKISNSCIVTIDPPFPS